MSRVTAMAQHEVVGTGLSVAPRVPRDEAGPALRVASSAVLTGVGIELVAAVARLSDLVAGVAAWPAGDRRAALGMVDRATAALGVVRARVLAAEAESGEWALRGDRSVTAWRARTGGAGFSTASREVRQAQVVTAMPATADAVTEGRMGAAHLDELARVVDRAGPVVREALAEPESQRALVEVASRQDAPTFGRTLARMVAALDPAGLEARHQAQRRDRFLNLADGPDGTRLTGLLDAMSGHRVRLALDAMTGTPAADDDRAAQQRRADALIGLADHALADPAVAPGAVVTPHVSILMSPETWAALREGGRAADSGVGADGAGVGGEVAGGGVAGGAGTDHGGTGGDAAGETGVGGWSAAAWGALAGVPAARLVDGTPVPASVLARTLCDCAVMRVVVDAAGRPVDLGRDSRLFSPAQRRAVLARDGGCAWPACGIPARYCEIHHIRWWDRDGGPTDTANGIALCSFHHHRVHESDVRITRVPVTGLDARGRPTGLLDGIATTARNGVGLAAYRITRRDGRVAGPDPGGGPDPDGGADPRVRPDPRGGVDPSRGSTPGGGSSPGGGTDPGGGAGSGGGTEPGGVLDPGGTEPGGGPYPGSGGRAGGVRLGEQVALDLSG